MKHPSIRRLFAHWNERRGRRPAPERSEIDPAELRHALGDIFMLAADFADELRFRLAGTRVCTLFCREIKGEAFAALWSDSSLATAARLTAAVVDEAEGAFAELAGHTADGSEAELEMLVLPLAHAGQARIRALGALVPVVPPYWLGEKPIAEIEFRAVRPLQLTPAGHPAHLAALPDRPRSRHGFVVYSGGRAAVPEQGG